MLRKEQVPFAVLLISLLATAATVAYVQRAAKAIDRARFDLAVQTVGDRLQDRLDHHVNALRATAGFLSVDPDASEAEFRMFVQRFRIAELYPGMQGLGWSRAFRDRDEWLRFSAAQSVADPGYHAWPLTIRDEYHAIVQLEPRDRRNQRAIGYDMTTEPRRRQAMHLARDSGSPSMTSPVTLVQEIDQRKQPGFLIYVPIYSGGVVPQTVAERRARFVGVASSPFRAYDFAEGIFGRRLGDRVVFQIWDTHIAEGNLLYASAPYRSGTGILSATRVIRATGREWIVTIESGAAFESASGHNLVLAIIGIGLGVSLLLFLLTMSIARARLQAERTTADLQASQNALRSSEARLRRLVESNLIGIVISDAHGSIVDANGAFLRMLDLQPAELESRTLSLPQLTPRELRERDDEVAQLVAQRGEHPPYEKELCSRQGKRIPVLIGTAVIPGDEQMRVSFVLDLTELKAAEAERDALLIRERAARAEAERANRSKDEFLATLSHELRTPMTSIIGWARMLEQGGLDAELTRTAVEAIQRSSASQAQLIEDLLDVSRIAVGKFRVEMRELDLRDVIEAAVEQVTPSAVAKEIELTVELSGESEISVCGDYQRLQQVIWNLLTNAIKFTPDGGKVRVETTSDSTRVLLHVIDYGLGIDPQFLPHVFERFRQADASTTRSHTGLGLGLALVRHIVELHGGTVEAFSDGVGRGSRFTVTLPLHRRTKRVTRENTVTAKAALDGTRVLVVEDEADVRLLVATMIERAGGRVTAVESVQRAREVIARGELDAIVSDIAMPHEDGIALLHWIRANDSEQVRTLPVIAVTAHAREQDEAAMLAAGFNAYVRKPVDAERLIGAICDSLHEA